MQKLITGLAIISGFAAVAFRAEAIENDYKPYLGLDYAYNVISANPHYNSFRAILGSVYNPYFGTEVFYQYSGRDKLNKDDVRTTSFNAYGLDMQAGLPLGNSGIVPLATLGIGQYTIKHKFTDGGHNDDHGWGYRFGGGLRYDIDDNWSATAIARYIKTDKIAVYKHLDEYTIGLRYTFR